MRVREFYAALFRSKWLTSTGISLGLCGAFTTNAFSQSIENDDRFNVYAMPGVPSPTAASLGQYAKYAVSSYTGVPDISVPLYELTVDDFKLPISLSYNTEGVKIANVASWVGTGWSLNCGGVITRNVMDIPDDMAGFQQGWLFYNYLVKPNPPGNNSGIYGYSPFNRPEVNQTGLGLMRDGGFTVDTEPDVFYFNFNGHVGKFLFGQGSDPIDHTGQILATAHTINIIPYQDLKITYTFENHSGIGGNTSKSLKEFLIIDESGNSYYFDKSEQTLSHTRMYGYNTNNSLDAGFDVSRNGYSGYKSSWYLSKIVTAKGKTITFNYVTESYTQTLPMNYLVRNFDQSSPGVSHLDCSKPYKTGRAKTISTDNTITGQRLASIEGDDFLIEFQANEARQDLAGAKALTAITVFHKQASNLTEVKKLNLNYAYFQSPIDPTLDNSITNGDPNKRLKLLRVIEIGRNGVALPPYEFNYEETYSLPNKYSPHQDFWGYFNNNTCNTLIPTTYIYPEDLGSERFSMFRRTNNDGIEFTINGADRSTNPTAILAGTLKRITFPLGGHEEFKFAPHEFYNIDRNILGGGLRLEKSTRYDGLNHANDIITSYSYKQTTNTGRSSGVLFDLPIFAYTENFLPYWDGITPNQIRPRAAGEFDPETFIYFRYNLVLASAPNFTLSGYDGINVGYSEITEHINGNGYTTTTYSTPGKIYSLNDNAGDGCNVSTDGYCDGLFKAGEVIAYTAPGNCSNGPDLDIPDLTGLELTANGYPFAPKTNYDWNRGLPLSKKFFTENMKLVKEVTNNYNIFTPNKAQPLYIYGLRKARMSNYGLYWSRCWNISGIPKFDVVSMYPAITNIAKVLGKVTTKTYSQDNGSQLSTIEEYKYDGQQKIASEISQTASNGDKIISRYFYPMDYDAGNVNTPLLTSLTRGIQNLQNKHVINAPVQSYKERQPASGGNTIITGGNFFEYDPSGILPQSIYQMELTTPLTGPGQIQKSGVNIEIPAAYRLATSLKFNPANNAMVEYKTAPGRVSTGFVWNTTGRYMLAKVTNTTVTDIFHESFEEDYLNSTTQYSHTGKRAHVGTYTKTVTGITNGTYELRYWKMESDGTWAMVIKDNIVVTNNYYTIGLIGTKDDITFYPANAEVSIYTYLPLIGLTSETNAAGRTIYYEYDAFRRLRCIKDDKGKILELYEYNY